MRDQSCWGNGCAGDPLILLQPPQEVALGTGAERSGILQEEKRVKDHWVSSSLGEEMVPSWPVFCAAPSDHVTTVNWRARRCLWASLALLPSHPPFVPAGRRQVPSPIVYQGLLHACQCTGYSLWRDWALNGGWEVFFPCAVNVLEAFPMLFPSL